LSEFDVAQLSCDTVVLSNGAQGVEISGWPSPFSVSHGTQSDFPQLYPWFPQSRRSVEYGRLWEERQKSVLSSADVVAAFGTRLEPKCERLGACFLAEFAPDKPTTLERVRDASEIEAFLHRVCLGSRDPIYLNWHGFVTCDAATIDGSLRAWAAWLSTRETYRLTWAPSAVSLMKRVRRVGRLHRDLRRLLETPTE
jgi:hypothetical protein